MYMNDEEILDDFVKSRNLKPISKKAYKASIKLYTEYHQMTLQDLIKEAEIEEDTGIRWKRRKLKRRLINFRTFLAEKYLKNYAKKHIQQNPNNIQTLRNRNT